MLFGNIQPHPRQLLAQLPGGKAAVVGQKQILFSLIMEPPDKLRGPRQDMVSVIDHAVHIANKALFLRKVNCIHNITLFPKSSFPHYSRHGPGAKPRFGKEKVK